MNLPFNKGQFQIISVLRRLEQPKEIELITTKRFYNQLFLLKFFLSQNWWNAWKLKLDTNTHTVWQFLIIFIDAAGKYMIGECARENGKWILSEEVGEMLIRLYWNRKTTQFNWFLSIDIRMYLRRTKQKNLTIYLITFSFHHVGDLTMRREYLEKETGESIVCFES